MSYEVLGVDVRVAETGAGAPMLLLHGNPDAGEVWEPVVSRLATRRRFLMPDLPGYGGSRAPRDFDCALPNQARFVDELLDALGVSERVDLVVHDVGGSFGLSWAATHPERLRSLTILNTNFFPDYRWHFWARVWRTPLLGELTMGVANWPLFSNEMRRGSPRIPTEYVRRAYQRFTPETRRMVLRWYRAMDPEALIGWDQRLLAVTARLPTQVIWGDRDPYLPASTAERFGGQVHRFPDCGHWTQLEAPERVAAQIDAFLKGQ
jgi:pimeloyl-ACP methyl ester carboxylesterase